MQSWLAAEVGRRAPDVGLLGPGLRRRTAREWTVTLAPIDGTDAYLARLPTWSVSVGLLHGTKPVAGVVLLPSIDDLYLAWRGAMRWNDSAISAEERSRGVANLVLAGSTLRRRVFLRLGRDPVVAAPTGYHLSLVARGAAAAAVLGRVHLWEIAAGWALLDAVGGEIVSLDSGIPLDLARLLDGRRSTEIAVAGMRDARSALPDKLRRR
jgi:myo-inositol-1(or 4)-monophosphatase